MKHEDRTMPYFHILLHLFTYNKFMEHYMKSEVQSFANAIHEYRMLPLPYGLLAHELIEVIDQERIMKQYGGMKNVHIVDYETLKFRRRKDAVIFNLRHG